MFHLDKRCLVELNLLSSSAREFYFNNNFRTRVKINKAFGSITIHLTLLHPQIAGVQFSGSPLTVTARCCHPQNKYRCAFEQAFNSALNMAEQAINTPEQFLELNRKFYELTKENERLMKENARKQLLLQESPDPASIFDATKTGTQITPGITPICVQELLELYGSDEFLELAGEDTFKLMNDANLDVDAMKERIEYIRNSSVVRKIDELQNKIIDIKLATVDAKNKPGIALSRITSFSDPSVKILTYNAKTAKISKMFSRHKNIGVAAGYHMKEGDTLTVPAKSNMKFHLTNLPQGYKVAYMDYPTKQENIPLDMFCVVLQANHELDLSSGRCRRSSDGGYVYHVKGREMTEYDVELPTALTRPLSVTDGTHTIHVQAHRTQMSGNYLLTYSTPHCRYNVGKFEKCDMVIQDLFREPIKMIPAEEFGDSAVTAVTPKFNGTRLYVLISEGHCLLISAKSAPTEDRKSRIYTVTHRAKCVSLEPHSPSVLFEAEKVPGPSLIMLRLLRYEGMSLPFDLKDTCYIQVNYDDHYSFHSVDWLDPALHKYQHYKLLNKGRKEKHSEVTSKIKNDGAILHIQRHANWYEQVYLRTEQQHDVNQITARAWLGVDLAEPGVQQVSLTGTNSKGILKTPRTDKTTPDSAAKIIDAEKSTAAAALMFSNEINDTRYGKAIFNGMLPVFGQVTLMQQLTRGNKNVSVEEFKTTLAHSVSRMSTQQMQWLIGQIPMMEYDTKGASPQVWRVFIGDKVQLQFGSDLKLEFASAIDPDTYQKIHDNLDYAAGVPDPATLVYALETIHSLMRANGTLGRRLESSVANQAPYMSHIMGNRGHKLTRSDTIVVYITDSFPAEVMKPRIVISSKPADRRCADVRQLLWFTPYSGKCIAKYVNYFHARSPKTFITNQNDMYYAEDVFE